MGKVLDFSRKIKETFRDKDCYLLCSCQSGGTPFLPMVISSENPTITHLFCPACNYELPVSGGTVYEEP